MRPWFAAAVIGFFAGAWWLCVRMPSNSYTGPLPSLKESQSERQAKLETWLDAVAGDGMLRSTANPNGLESCLVFLEGELRAMGYAPTRDSYEALGLAVSNLVAERPGAAAGAGIFVVGAHYDAYRGTTGANDNGSGVAALLALAERFKDARPDRTLRLVFFTNEEPPHFQRSSMGSLVYAEECRQRGDDIRGMWSLETMAYYSDEAGSQDYPSRALKLAYPSRGNFIAFVGNVSSRTLVRATLGRFRDVTSFPSEGAALPGWVSGVGWSDHWSFARIGYPALMITDTANFRDPAYHTPLDRPGRLDLSKLARVAEGLGHVLDDLLSADARF